MNPVVGVLVTVAATVGVFLWLRWLHRVDAAEAEDAAAQERIANRYRQDGPGWRR